MTEYRVDYKAEPRQRDTDWVMEEAQVALRAPVFRTTDVRGLRSTDGPHNYHSSGDY